MTTQSSSTEKFDVVIVGGGLAGLTVAYRLGDKSVLLLEKEDVIGGRTVSMEMGPYIFNQGAQMIPGADSNVARLADELGVRRTLIDKTKTCTHMNGKLVASSSDFRYLLRLPIPLLARFKLGLNVLRLRSRYSGVVDKPPRADDKRFRELSEQSLVELMKIRDPDVKALWDAFSMAASTLACDEVAAFQPVNTFLHHAADEFFVEGGTGQLTRSLGEQISARVETDASVTSVESNGGAVTVKYQQDGVACAAEAKQCVMAIPAPSALGVLRNIPEAKRAALAQCEYGAMSSAAFLVDKPSEHFLGKGIWRIPVVGKRIIGISDPTYTFSAQMKQEDGRGLIRLYAGNEASEKLQEMPDDESLAIFEEELVEVFPEVIGGVLARAVKHWPHAICPWRVGRLDLIDKIRAPYDNIHFCGDYTENSGLESAVLSAIRVVAELGAGR
ncbi:MAG: FAD-dependent oxidoreductase [Chloroflexi bacterium]|nr:FAD-dependent oxidoreductase [Chloroflexota bacterium]